VSLLSILVNEIRLDEGRLLDFCTFVNAITLYDRLITLPARLPDDIIDSALYKYLLKERILYEYSSYVESVQEELDDFLGGGIYTTNVGHQDYYYHHGVVRDMDFDDSMSYNTGDNSPRSKFIQEIIRV
jgi:hypothetical protein